MGVWSGDEFCVESLVVVVGWSALGQGERRAASQARLGITSTHKAERHVGNLPIGPTL